MDEVDLLQQRGGAKIRFAAGRDRDVVGLAPGDLGLAVHRSGPGVARDPRSGYSTLPTSSHAPEQKMSICALQSWLNAHSHLAASIGRPTQPCDERMLPKIEVGLQ